MNYIECENLFKKYEQTEIDFSFSAEKNSLTAIVGPSGSGKSTVLKMIAGLVQSDNPQSKIYINGIDNSKLSPSKRNLGMVFQSPALFLNMNVLDNVAFGLKCKGIPSKEAKLQAMEFLKMINLSGFEKRMPHTLSGGEAQRVSLARTLIIKPDLLLLDEPLSALDAPLRKSLGNEILNMKNNLGFTAIMVTHDIEEAKRMADSIILLKQGKNFWQGKPDDFNGENFF